MHYSNYYGWVMGNKLRITSEWPYNGIPNVNIYTIIMRCYIKGISMQHYTSLQIYNPEGLRL